MSKIPGLCELASQYRAVIYRLDCIRFDICKAIKVTLICTGPHQSNVYCLGHDS